MQNTPSLSVVVNTMNSEKFLELALASAAFADEIIIVDMHSTDATQKIAKKFTNKIFMFEDIGYVEPARNFAIEKATSDWILILDADEEISNGLQLKIKDILTEPTFDAYYIPRSNEVFGYEMRKTGWWPDHQLRLFKKGVVTWSDKIHSVPTVAGTSEYLQAMPEIAIKHHNYQSVSQFVDRMNRYTDIEANNDSDVPMTTAMVITSFRDELLRRLFSHDGIQEGMHGVGLSFLQSFYQVLVILKKWEQRGFKQHSATEKETLTALKEFQRSLVYWTYAYEIEHGSPIQKVIARIKRKIGI